MTDWAKEAETYKVDWAKEAEKYQSEEGTIEWKDAFKSALKNIPESAAEYGEAITQPIRHPVKTAKAMGTIAAGGAQKLIPGQQSEEIKEQEAAFDQAIDFFKNRYGSVENFKKTIAKDPVGVLGDVATIMSGAGAAIRGAGTVGKVGQITKVGGKIQRAAEFVEPTSLVTKGVGKLAGTASQGLYESAAKFSTTLTREQRMAISERATSEWVGLSQRGLDKIQKNLSKYEDAANSLINKAVESGKTIETKQLLRHFPELEKEAFYSELAQKQLNRVRRDIVDNLRNAGKESITVGEANKLKRLIYKKLKSHYSNVREAPIAIKAQKEIARAAKESIEEIIPEIKNVNKKWGEWIELEKNLTKSVNRIKNRDLIGIGSPIKIGAGAAAGGPVGAVAGLALALWDVPQIKSAVSLVLKKLEKAGKLTSSSRATAIKLGLYQSGGAGGEF